MADLSKAWDRALDKQNKPDPLRRAERSIDELTESVRQVGLAATEAAERISAAVTAITQAQMCRCWNPDVEELHSFADAGVVRRTCAACGKDVR